MAETINGEPIIVLSNYSANREAKMHKLKEILPKDRQGNCLINLPYALSARKTGHYDLLDTMTIQDSPYAKAAEALQLGMGQINPYAVMLSYSQMLCLKDYFQAA